MKPLPAVAGALALLLGSPAPASADVTVESFRCTVIAQDGGELAVDRSSGELAGAPGYTNSATSSGGDADHDTKVASSARSLIVRSEGTCRVSAGVNALADSSVVLRFTVTEAANFTLSADFDATGTDSGVLITLGTPASSQDVVFLGSGIDASPVLKTGTLQPGAYVFAVNSGLDDVMTGAGGDTFFDVELTVGTPKTIRWKRPSSGDFSTPANWDSAAVPERADIAVFDLPRTYTVTVGGRTTDQLKVRAGNPTFIQGDYQVANTLRALDVTGGAALTLGQGMSLRGHRAIVGETAGASSKAILTHATALWSLGNLLRIGEEGPGELHITAGSVVAQTTSVGSELGDGFGEVSVSGPASDFQTGELFFGRNGDAFLAVSDLALVQSREVIFGAGAGSLALASVVGRNEFDPERTRWLMDELTMFGASQCNLQIEGAALVEVQEGFDLWWPTPLGSSEVDVARGPALLSVGGGITLGGGFGAGHAILKIRDGGTVELNGPLWIGRGDDPLSVAPAGSATVEVSGGRLTSFPASSDGTLLIGSGLDARGTLRVTNAGSVVLGTVPVRVGDLLGTGVLEVGDGVTTSTFETLGEIDVGLASFGELRVIPGGELTAPRVIVHPSGLLTGDGEVSGTIVRKRPASTRAKPKPASPPKITCSELLNDGTVEAGSLVVEGDFTQTDAGTLVAQVAGPDPEDHDRLVVTGAATMAGRLRLQFMNGHAPRQGDAFDVLDVGGAATGSFAEVEVAGLLPGAQFGTAIAGGRLTATAMNDGVALPTVSVKPGKAKKGKEKKSKPASFVFQRKGDVSAQLVAAFLVEGSAENGADYAALPVEVVFPAGKKSVTLAVVPVDDAVIEGTETVTVRVVPGAESTPSSKSVATVTIADDERRPK